MKKLMIITCALVLQSCASLSHQNDNGFTEAFTSSPQDTQSPQMTVWNNTVGSPDHMVH